MDVGVSVWPELSVTVGVAQFTTMLDDPDGIVTAWLPGQVNTGSVLSIGESKIIWGKYGSVSYYQIVFILVLSTAIILHKFC